MIVLTFDHNQNCQSVTVQICDEIGNIEAGHVDIKALELVLILLFLLLCEYCRNHDKLYTQVETSNSEFHCMIISTFTKTFCIPVQLSKYRT